MTRIRRDLWIVFSPREWEVLQGMAQGQLPKAIARSLGIKTKTVRIYQTHIRSKLGRW